MIMVIDGGLIDNLRFNEFFGLIMLNGGLISISVFDSVMIFVIDKIGLFVLVIVGQLLNVSLFGLMQLVLIIEGMLGSDIVMGMFGND